MWVLAAPQPLASARLHWRATVMATTLQLLSLLLIFSLQTLHVSAWSASCNDHYYRKCYGVVHRCPPGCPKACEMDCNLCKPICPCDKPGAVCQDPRFIGGDGIMFYFHGKKDKDFCLVSDSDMHINAHFIGKSREGRRRDFTWVQAIAILFGKHQLYIGAKKVATWDDSIDQVNATFDQTPVVLPPGKGATWEAPVAGIKITRLENANAVTLEANEKYKIVVRVVPILAEESRVHNYGITADDCFAHLEINFKFYDLSSKVTGVLGQTYAAGFKSPVKIGVEMPIMGGDTMYATSSLTATDCAVSRFGTSLPVSLNEMMGFAALRCGSGPAGRGMVCRR